MKKRRTKLILTSVLAVFIIGYLVYTGIRDTMVYYLTVSELVHNGTQSSKGGVRLGGTVLEGSVSWEPKQLRLKFTVGDDRGATLPVVYQGVVPDSFKQGREVIVEGVYANGVFTASQIMPTCPSKYE